MPSVSDGALSGDQIYTPDEVVSSIFNYFKARAEAHLNGSVTHAVVAVPSGWNETQRQAVRNAAALGGLEVLRLMNEPVAAAIGQRLDLTDWEERQVVVLNVGATTTEATVVNIDDGGFEVIASASTAIGGRDFTDRAMTE